MNFQGALDQIKSGNKVRRERWNSEFYLHKHKHSTVIITNTEMLALDGFLNSNDLFAEDWVIYEDELSPAVNARVDFKKFDMQSHIKLYGGIELCVGKDNLLCIDEKSNFVINKELIDKLRFNLVINDKEKKKKKAA